MVDIHNVILMDASKLGTKVKEGKNQKTVLSDDEVTRIIDTFIEHKAVEDFSVVVTYDQIKEKNYSFSAGQYFDVKIEYVEMTADEFNQKVNEYVNDINKLWNEGHQLESEINNTIEELKYE